MTIILNQGCTDLDEEDVVGAAVAERGRATPDLGTRDVAADATGAIAAEEPAPARPEPPVGEVEGRPSGGVQAPPRQCCYVRCGAQVTYQKIPWAVETNCDQEGWKFCADFYVTKLTDAAWLPC